MSDGRATVAVAEGGTRLGADPVLAALHQAEEQYQEARAGWEQRLAEMGDARAAAASLHEANQRLTQELQKQQGLLARERQRAERQRERARQLAEGLKAVHRALFEGNVFALILKSCLTITGATRGLYLTVQGDRTAVRAAVDVDGYPQAPPSEFIRALCRKALDGGDTLVCNRPEDFPAGRDEARPGEQFRNCIVAPVVLLRDLNGVAILADKLQGPFDRDDVETVLSVGDQAAVAVQNQQLQRELQGIYYGIVSLLADAVEAKDPYTHGHCEMVARYARLTAERLALGARERGVVCYGGLLHDVGKIGVSDGVLNKPGQLLPEEWQLMRSHVRVGRDLLARVPHLGEVSDVVLYHHERFDGKGYPDGLTGEEIPLPARIVCVADAYCAMVSKRSYKESSSLEQARAELARNRGTQFDPDVVDAFLAVLDEEARRGGDEEEGAALPPGFDPQELWQVVQGTREQRR